MKKIFDQTATQRELEIAESLLNDGNQDAWEKGDLGKFREHTRKLTNDEVKANFSKDEPTIRATSMRMPDVLLRDLKKIAEQKGLPYQALVRMVLTEFVSKEKKAS